MPPIKSQRLAQVLSRALEACGATGVNLNPGNDRPHRFAIAHQGQPLSLWVYIWTLTFGGRPSLPDEYRIQMTGVASPLTHNPDGYTVLMGYEPNLNVFAGFDLARHSVFTQGSPSVQIDFDALRQASSEGLAFDRKTNDEIAIALRPELLLLYAQQARELHTLGPDARILRLLQDAAALRSLDPNRLSALSGDRQRVIRSVSSHARDANFRRQVLQAYDYRCALTGIKLGLIDAAHIVPVAMGSESPDEVRNGIALSPTYHRAFDRSLIYLTPEYEMRLNPRRLRELRDEQLGDGIESLRPHLGRIMLPLDRAQWPDTNLIQLANYRRGIGR